jgi:transposase
MQHIYVDRFVAFCYINRESKEAQPMRRLQISEAAVMRLALQQEISRSEEARYDHRLHGVLLVTSGMSCREVAGVLGEDPTTVQRWVHRFESRGFAGLQDGERSGRPRRLTEDQWSCVGRDLRKPPRELGYPQNLWDGKVLSYHLAQSYGVVLGTRQCQRVFRQMDFRRRKPRPLIAQADPAAQAAFKKTTPTGHRR